MSSDARLRPYCTNLRLQEIMVRWYVSRGETKRRAQLSGMASRVGATTEGGKRLGRLQNFKLNRIRLSNIAAHSRVPAFTNRAGTFEWLHGGAPRNAMARPDWSPRSHSSLSNGSRPLVEAIRGLSPRDEFACPSDLVRARLRPSDPDSTTSMRHERPSEPTSVVDECITNNGSFPLFSR